MSEQTRPEDGVMNTVLKPSVVLRRVKKGTIPRRIDGGKVRCEQCRELGKGDTESPAFWESGMYSFCDYCGAWTLSRPEFPGGLVIDLTGERTKYPVVLKREKSLRPPKTLVGEVGNE